MHELCTADPALKARWAILVSTPGIGETTARTLLIEMPELGAIENECLASLAGLAPIARDSGQHSGKRLIRGAALSRVRPSPCQPRSPSAPARR